MKVNESLSLTAKQEQLIALLVAGVAIVTAAKNVGIGEATAHRWLKLSRFQAAYKQAQHDLFSEALQGLREKVGKAIDTLDRHMDSDETPAGSQIRAAQIVLEQAIAIHKVTELEQKIAELERMLK